MLDRVAERAAEFDILHFHIDFFHYPLFRNMAHKTLTTLHGRQDLPELPDIYRAFPHMPLVSISDHQRKPVPPVNWMGTVYHGLPERQFREGGGGGRLSRLSGPHLPRQGTGRGHRDCRQGRDDAENCRQSRSGRPGLFRASRPALAGQKSRMSNSSARSMTAGSRNSWATPRALLFPICWPEPFGLVMIEAMACGTPVIAFRCGSVPEMLEDGLTGFVVDTMDQAARRPRDWMHAVPSLHPFAFRGTLQRPRHGAGILPNLWPADPVAGRRNRHRSGGVSGRRF